ncbi:MAG: hypothetical protein AAB906_02950, partial [Patescibacteria group bacterium]
YTSNITELLIFFDNDTTIFINEINELIENKMYKILYDNDIYDIIFIYTLSKKRQKEFSFKCQLNENDININNIITILNNKININHNNLLLALNRLVAQINTLEQSLISQNKTNIQLTSEIDTLKQYILHNSYIDIFNKYPDFVHNPPRKFKFMVGFEHIYTEHWEHECINYILTNNSSLVNNGYIDISINMGYFNALINNFLSGLTSNNVYNITNCNVVIQYNNKNYVYNTNNSCFKLNYPNTYCLI